MNAEYPLLVKPFTCEYLLSGRRKKIRSRPQLCQLTEFEDGVGLIELLDFDLGEGAILHQIGFQVICHLLDRLLLCVLVSESDKEVRIIVVMVSLLIFDFLAHVACGSNVSFLHSDVHVVPFNCLEHRVGLIARVGLKLHISVLFLEAGAFPSRSPRAHGGLEHPLVVLILYNDTLATMTHLALLCEDLGD